MGYLTEEQLDEISEMVEFKSIEEIKEGLSYSFDCKVKEYNDFLSLAKSFCDLNISKTHLLFDKENHELIGYMTLSNDTLRLSKKEKCSHGLESVPFVSIPAIKIGKLAINKEITHKIKGYGSFLIEMARAFAFQINEMGVACRFLTVDADIEYDEGNVEFYKKSGFIINNREEYQKQKEKYKTVSMRMDIFNEPVESLVSFEEETG